MTDFIPEVRDGAILFLKTDVVPEGYKRLERLEKMGLPPWRDGPVAASESSGKSLESLGIMVIVKIKETKEVAKASRYTNKRRKKS